jgi:hypothetical protein
MASFYHHEVSSQLGSCSQVRNCSQKPILGQPQSKYDGIQTPALHKTNTSANFIYGRCAGIISKGRSRLLAYISKFTAVQLLDERVRRERGFMLQMGMSTCFDYCRERETKDFPRSERAIHPSLSLGNGRRVWILNGNFSAFPEPLSEDL